MTPFRTGAILKDRYRLEHLLGRGGMASVWRATDEVLERPVAIKILSDTIASDPEFLARFRREARVAAGLSHPNLVAVFDYASEEERPYLVMEYIEGETLAERVSRGERTDCRGLARELLGALSHIHAAGIVHRDIKPQNVLLAPDGRAKLIDFGIALPADATSLTRTGQFLGTARFVAPETARGEGSSERSDLYSCGVVLRDCMAADAAGPLAELVDSLCAADPEDRPVSAGAALAALERLSVHRRGALLDEPTMPYRIEEEPTTAESEEPAPEPAPAPAGSKRLGRALAALALVAAAVAIVAVVLAGGDSSDPGGNGGGAPQAKVREKTGAQTGAEAPEAAEETSEPEAETEPVGEVPEAAGSDAALGSALNEEGFALIQAGSYEEAIPVLEEAVRAFPPGTEDPAYGYALFNLGNALRLSGRPEEAIPILERRLEIPDQTDAVQQELTTAREEASSF